MRSGCPDLLPLMSNCIAQCQSDAEFFNDFVPACSSQYAAMNNCFAAVPPGQPENWFCIEESVPVPATACQNEVNTFNTCFNDNFPF